MNTIRDKYAENAKESFEDSITKKYKRRKSIVSFDDNIQGINELKHKKLFFIDIYLYLISKMAQYPANMLK